MQLANNKKLILSQILIILLVIFSLKAQEHESSDLNDKHNSEKFEPGDFIIGHVIDAHEWHILNIGDFHLTIPLPVILYSETSGLHIFSSSRFHNPEKKYESNW